MDFKGWGIAPFDPTKKAVLNKSSRKLTEMVVSVARYGLQIDKEVRFDLGITNPESFVWVMFKNTGRNTLTNLKATIPAPFKLDGGIPKVLRPGESFKVRISFMPKRTAHYERYLVLANEFASFNFPLFGTYKDYLIYNGDASYNGRFVYMA